MKIINNLFTIIQFLIIVIVVGAMVLFVELTLVSYFDNLFIQFIVRLLFILILYIIIKIFKFKAIIMFTLIFGYITMTTYILLSSDSKVDDINSSVSIQKKSIFKTKDQKHKYTYGTIEEKIIILNNLGLTKEQVYDKLENNTDFRILIKNGDNKFNSIFSSVNKKNE